MQGTFAFCQNVNVNKIKVRKIPLYFISWNIGSVVGISSVSYVCRPPKYIINIISLTLDFMYGLFSSRTLSKTFIVFLLSIGG